MQPGGFPSGFPQQPGPGGFPGQQQQQQAAPPAAPGFPTPPGPGAGFPGQFPGQQQQMQPPMQQMQPPMQPPMQQPPANYGQPPPNGFPPPAAGAGAGAYAPQNGPGLTLGSIFAGSSEVDPQSRTPRLDVNGVYGLKLRKIIGGFTETEKKPFVEFEWEIAQPDVSAGPSMPAGKIIGMFIMQSSHKLNKLFIGNVKEILIPIMTARYGRVIQPQECGDQQILESFSQAQPYTGTFLWCRAQNTGKTSNKGNPIWDYQWIQPQR